YTQTCPSGKAEVTESCPSARTADSSGASLTRHPGQDIPRKRGPGVTRSDLLVINKIDLAPYVGVDPALLERDAKAARGARPFVMASLKTGQGVAEVVAFLRRDGGL
ncbi:MAG: GTP-binding protein, partial [Cereibacter sp.]